LPPRQEGNRDPCRREARCQEPIHGVRDGTARGESLTQAPATLKVVAQFEEFGQRGAVAFLNGDVLEPQTAGVELLKATRAETAGLSQRRMEAEGMSRRRG